MELKLISYLVGIGVEIIEEEIKWDGCHEVNDEPTPEVMNGNSAWIGYNLIIGIDVGCPEIY